MAELNSTIVDRVWAVSTNDYQQRVPLTSTFDNPMDGLKAVQEKLWEPGNGRLWNEFLDGFVTLIGKQRVNQVVWENPLAVFKKDHFLNGKHFQDYALDFVQGEAYSQEDTAAILRNRKVDLKGAFYSVNRRVRYPVTVNEAMARASFNSPNGLNDYISAVLNAPMVSDQYDEYQFMKNAFAAANLKNPFYNVQSTIANPGAPTEAELKDLSRKIRTVGLQMGTAPNGRYNAYGVPTITRKEDLVLITTPEVRASMSVEVLASAFNRDEADFVNELILVDELPWADAWAILVDRKGVIAGDSLLEMTSFYNGATLTTNFWLHHHGGYAISPIHNIAVFSNSADTQIGVVTVGVDSISAHFERNGETVTTAKPGSKVKMVVEATGDFDPATGADVFRTPGTWTAKITAGEGQEVSSRTFVGSDGTFHVAPDVEAGTVLTVEVTAAYYDPSAPIGSTTTPITTEATLTVN